MSNTKIREKISNLPKSPGVYEFRDKKGKILYIGKATSLRDRVGSYFRDQSLALGAPKAKLLVARIADIKIHETNSVLEALILEANLIKKHQPKYNIEGKDDKSFAYAVITKEKFPRVLVVREMDLNRVVIARSEATKQSRKKNKYGIATLPAVARDDKITFGPYTSKKQLEIALKLIRKIFPYHSAKQISRNCCFDHQIGLCPGPYVGAISKKDYLKNIRNIEMILRGKKKQLVSALKKEMKDCAKKNEFEKAAEARNRIFALEHIRDVALISEDTIFSKSLALGEKKKIRTEAYDISNIGGDFATGSMIVFSGNKPDKSQYRKFRILAVNGIDDVGMMREVLKRRFQNDWPLPELIFVDGGKGHLNMARNAIAEFGYDIPVVAVAKGPTRKKLDIYYNKEALTFHNIISDKKLIERIRNEAHRFAISYHKKLRGKNWKEK